MVSVCVCMYACAYAHAFTWTAMPQADTVPTGMPEMTASTVADHFYEMFSAKRDRVKMLMVQHHALPSVFIACRAMATGANGVAMRVAA